MTHTENQIRAAIEAEVTGWAAGFEVTDPAQIEARRAFHRANLALGHEGALAKYLAFELDIDAATQSATVYVNGRPFATCIRRRVYTKGPEWTVHDLTGRKLFHSITTPGLFRLMANHVKRHAPAA